MSVLNILDKLGEKVNMWFILLGSADYNAILISLSGRWAGGGAFCLTVMINDSAATAGRTGKWIICFISHSGRPGRGVGTLHWQSGRWE